ncbi:hypothetical protein [Variovorax sp. JS1663]|uniref:hypothetical protein n=1 Tax=Variovorax sp. JS1663 TaxID=1851577 RepID=UPI000B346B9F|nr:hypothetical protein [Variovorax sp. JS1663]OUM04112.1 hypothetical protein A8M77_03630 [Variovorax sp. JS1663]
MKAKRGAAHTTRQSPSGPRVVLAWEHGLHYGHVSRLAAAAEVVERHGGRPVWALPEARLQKAAFFDASHERVKAPAAPAPRPANGTLHSFADVLLNMGFAEVSAMAIRVRSWMRLFAELSPASVVLDNAPAAQLAARLMGLRCFQLTNGFDAPPARCPDFSAGERRPQVLQLHATSLATLERNLRRTAMLCTGHGEVTVADFLAWPQTVFDGLLETDPYGPRHLDWWVGPLGAPPHALPLSWPERGKGDKRVLAYMRATLGGTEALGGLANRGVNCLCVWPGVPARTLARFERSSVQILPHARSLQRLLPQADAVLSYGATSFVCQSLLAGKPQLVLPMDVEKRLIANRVAWHGAGIVWHSQAEEDLHHCLDRLLHADAVASAARDIAAGYADLPWEARKVAWGQAMLGLDGAEGEGLEGVA